MAKKVFFLSAVLVLASLLSATAQTTPRWLRQNSISPDGSAVAFVYQGDIYRVPVAGGEAVRLTTNPAHDTEPLWSPDGKYIIFASFREGQKDIWAIPSAGGEPRRLTDYGGEQTPFCVSPSGDIYFGGNLGESASSAAFPGWTKLYKINLDEALSVPEGGILPEPVRVSSMNIGAASVDANGAVLYEDVKGMEDPFRKHHTSAVTRDVWKLENGVYTKVTDFIGEDRNPVFAPDGKSFFFLSEQGEKKLSVDDWAGDLNVWKSSLSGGTPVRVTSFTGNPVRYLSVAGNGTLCFSWNGDLYTMKEGEANPSKIDISIKKDRDSKEHIFKTAVDGVSDFAVSPGEKEIAIVSRGDVYVTPVDLKETRRITCTAEQERGVSFGKDGRSLYYASERNGEWAIYKTTLQDKKDKLFSFAVDTKEERVTPVGQTCFQPKVSPDGKKLAYLRNRTGIVVMDISSGKDKVLLEEGVNYSYSDGDLNFEWSPDSRFLLTGYQGGGRMYNEDVAMIDVESGKLTDLTESGYSDVAFRWALGGKAMTWESDKAGYRSHGSWGAEGDIYIMFFDNEAYLDFIKDKDQREIDKLLAEDKKNDKKDTTKVEKVKKLEMDLENRQDRIVRLTPQSGRLGDHLLTPDGKKLYYSVQLEKGRDLCCLDIESGSVKVVKKGFSGPLVLSPDGKSIYTLSMGGVSKGDIKSFSTKNIDFKGEYEYFPDKEREYIFEHCWKEVKEKWYDPDMHGVDWDAVAANYRQFLPYINDNFAFRELLSEMLGELNGSHTGGRYRHGISAPTGRLGVIFDEEYNGKGLKIKEFLPNSRLLAAAPGMEPGDLIVAIEGKEIPAGKPWYNVFERTAGKRILLTVKEGGKEKKVFVVPGSGETEQLYQRWVRNNEKMVERLSGGRVGYVHVKGMNSPSFREVYSKALGKYRNCDALIVDIRYNGGGWLHNDLATFLDGKLYTERRPRGVFMGPEPYDKWIKPSCVVTCESDYSDACGFPYVYRALGIGKIIGAPVAGTATSVWWETQVDPTLIFGIPQVGSFSVQNGRYLENLQLNPDIEVYNDPASLERGEDKQLEAAVAEMLKTIKSQD